MAWRHFIPLILLWCQPVHSDDGDAAAALKQLNTTLSGRLQLARPLAEPCFTDPISQACTDIQSGLPSAYFRTSQYAGFRNLQGESCASNMTASCLLSSDGTTLQSCQQGLVSTHFVPVTSAEDVQAALNYARTTKRTLSIKNSGVDYVGRSSRAESLALWTRNLQSMTLHESFVPAGCHAKGQRAITVSAGVATDELYRFAHANHVSYHGGTYASVGASGGWLLGGGHGPFTGSKGLGVDRVLEFSAVTPDGQTRVVNRCQNEDLFWALRGGGAGSLGVVLSSTSAVERERAVTVVTIGLDSDGEAKELVKEKFVGMLAEGMRDWVLRGWGGYSKGNSSVLIREGDDVAKAEEEMRNITDFVTSIGGKVDITTNPSFFDFYVNVINGSAAVPVAISTAAYVSSRLIPEAVFQDVSRRARMVDAIVQMEKDGKSVSILTTTSLAFARSQGFAPGAGNGNTSVHPAWYDSVMIVSHELDWQASASLEERKAMVAGFRKDTQLWKDIVPDGATYSNEADPWLPDWSTQYWGEENYKRLLEVKKKYDPDGLLSCWHCVGWEETMPDYGCISGLAVT